MRISVTRHHIATGCRAIGNGCPVHGAITDALGARLSGWLVSVRSAEVEFSRVARRILEPSGPSLYVALAEDVTLRIIAYDAIGEMVPFSFELDDGVLAQLVGEREVSRAG